MDLLYWLVYIPVFLSTVGQNTKGLKNWKREEEDDFLKENFGACLSFYLKAEDLHKTEVRDFVRFIPLNTHIDPF